MQNGDVQGTCGRRAGIGSLGTRVHQRIYREPRRRCGVFLEPRAASSEPCTNPRLPCASGQSLGRGFSTATSRPQTTGRMLPASAATGRAVTGRARREPVAPGSPCAGSGPELRPPLLPAPGRTRSNGVAPAGRRPSTVTACTGPAPAPPRPAPPRRLRTVAHTADEGLRRRDGPEPGPSGRVRAAPASRPRRSLRARSVRGRHPSRAMDASRRASESDRRRALCGPGAFAAGIRVLCNGTLRAPICGLRFAGYRQLTARPVKLVTAPSTGVTVSHPRHSEPDGVRGRQEMSWTGGDSEALEAARI